MSSKVPNSVVEVDYCIEDDKLIITKGTKGNSIDEEKVKEQNKIINNLDLDNINTSLFLCRKLFY